MRHSIKSKILFWLIIIIITIGAFISVIVSSQIQKILFANKKASIQAINGEDAHQLTHILDNTALFVQMIATKSEVVRYLSLPSVAKKGEIAVLFDSFQKTKPDFLSLYLIDGTGSAQISTDRTFLGVNFAFRPYFQEAMKGRPYVDVALGKMTNKLGYYFSHPVVSSEGKVLGVVVIKMDPSAVYFALNGNSKQTDGTYMMTDLSGIVLYSTKKNREMKSVGTLSQKIQVTLNKSNAFLGKQITPLWYEDLQQVINSQAVSHTFEYIDEIDHDKEILSISKVERYPFYFISEVQLGSVVGEIDAIARLIGLGIFSAALLSLIIISLIVRKLLNPLEQLKTHAKKLGRGSFNEKLTLDTGDELEELGDVMMQMQQSLAAMYQDLEKKVSQKTSELTLQLEKTQDTKRAMLNLLEDLSKQKDKMQKHAIELQKFELAVENAHDHIVITDPDGKILFANKAVESITGYSREEIFSKKAGSKKLWGGHMGQKTYELFWNRIKIEKKVFVGEFQNRRKSGEKYIAEAQVSPILDKQGNVLFFVGIERDITKAKEIDRMKTEFISLASHQLRTPLSAMKWFLEMLLHGDAGPLSIEQTEFINNVEQSNNRMIELVNSLLNVSRIESGRIIIEPSPTNLKQIVDEVQNEIIMKLNEKKQRLIITIHQSLPLIPLDQKLIRQVFINLLTNAIKYSPPGEDITIIISKENNEMVVQVADNGYGIPSSEHIHIFDKFYRATNAIKKETEGNGLGLYLVKSIIESSGGKIWFTSEENKGSSFYFTIPLYGMAKKEGEVRMS